MFHTLWIAQTRRSAGRTVRACGVMLLLLQLGFTPRAMAQCPPSWIAGIGTPGANGIVAAMGVLPCGDVIIGGAFTTLVGTSLNRISRYNPVTGACTALGTGANNSVLSLLPLAGGDVIAGGYFTSIGGVAATRIARYNPATAAWSALGTGLTGGTLPSALAFAELPGGDIIVGGQFTSAGGVPASRIARYNPTTGVWTALGLGVNGDVNAITLLAGGDLLVAGAFTTAGGGAANRIARYNPTTGVWSALGTGTNNTVFTLARLAGGDVVVGGQFTSAGGVAANRIARCNPTTSVWSALGSGADNTVNALAIAADGDVLAGGSFVNIGGVAANSVARYDMMTGTWSALGAGANALVRTLAVLPSEDLMVGGDFTTAGGVTATRIARVFPGASAPSIITQPLPVVTTASNNALFFVGVPAGTGTGAVTYQWRKGGTAINVISNPSAATPVLSLINVQIVDVDSYDCLVTSACGSTASDAATLTFVTDPCPGDFNGDGFVDFTDFDAFVTAFEAGC